MKHVDATSRMLLEKLEPLLHAEQQAYASVTPSSFPDEPGIYIISSGWQTIRAGKTTSLKQRLYSNHLMGDQSGNLRAQLVRSGDCSDLAAAKVWIRENCVVKYLIIQDETERSQLEHFMLSLIQPKFCDKNKVN